MATLSGNKIKDTYQSLIKLTDNGNLTTGAKQLTDGFGNNSPLYISTTQIGIGVTPEATYDLHVYSNAKVGGNLTVTGDLTVEGTTTTIDTQTLTVEDPLIEVASNNTSTDAVDIGWYGKYAPSGTVLYAGLFRDTGDSKFKLFRNLEEQPTTTVNTSGTGYTVATLVADVEGTLTGIIASSTTATTQSAGDNSTKVATTAYVDTEVGNYLPLAGGTMSGSIAMGGNNISGGGTATFTSFVGDLTGNADTATALETARTIQVSGDIAGSASFDGTADINISTTIQPNSVALGTDTTGNYVATISGTANEITVSGSGSESAAVTISLPSSISVDVTGDLTGDVYNADGSIILNTGDNSNDAVLSNGVRATTQSQGDNSTKLATTAYVDSAIGGQDTLSEVLANGNTTGGTDIAVSAGDDITFADDSQAIFGTNSDLKIYHDNTNAFVDNNTGSLYFTNYSDDKDIIFRTDDGSGGVVNYARIDGSSEEFLFLRKTRHNDNITADFGTGRDLQIYHDGSNSYIDEDGTGSLFIKSSFLKIRNNSNESMIDAISDGAVNLYYDNSKKFETTSTGVTITGGLSTTNSITLSNPTDKYIRFIDTYGNWQIEVGDGANNFKIHSQSLAADYLTLEGGGQLNLGEYGSGSFTGTAAYNLSVDSSGNIIETAGGVIDGSGTATFLPRWIDSNTLGDSILNQSSNDIIIGYNSNSTHSFEKTFATGHATGNRGAEVHFGMDDGGGNVGMRVIDSASSNASFNAQHIEFHTHEGGVSVGKRMEILSTGNSIFYNSVGIGTSSPSTKLETVGIIKSSGNGASFMFEDRVNSGNNWEWFSAYNKAGLYKNHNTAATVMTIDSSGQVGIGTDSPSYKLDVTGSIKASVQGRFANGSASAPSYSFDADSDSGMYRATTNTLGFSTAGTERMLIDDTGFVSFSQGDGTIGGAASITHHTNNYLYIRGGSAGIVVGDDGSDSRMLVANNNFINFETQNTERMRITSGGNVGINTTGNHFGEKLRVQGWITSGSDSIVALMGENATGAVMGAYSNHPLILRTNNTERMRIDNSGKVGIGTDSPDGKLKVVSGSSPNAAQILIGYNSTSENYFDANTQIFRNGSYAEKMRLDSSGNLGIGTTTNISSPLTVQTDGSANSISIIGRNNGTSDEAIISFYEYDGTTRNSYIIKDGGDLAIATGTGGSPSERMRIDSSGNATFAGNVTINKASNPTKLQIGSSLADDPFIHFQTDGESYSVGVDRSDSNKFKISNGTDVATNTRVTMDTSGNVGIGTTSPSAKLDVQSSGSWGQYGRGSSGDINVENTNTSVTEGGWIGIAGYTGNSANSGFYHMAGITAKKSTTAGDGNYGGDLSFWTTSGGANGEANSGMYQRMTIDSSGNVGIGTDSPTNLLDVKSNGSSKGLDIHHSNGNMVAQLIHGGSGDEGQLKLYDSNSETVRIAGENNVDSFINSGNLGIGTTSPSEKLTVDGNLKVLKGDDARIYINDVGDSSTVLLRSDGSNTSIGTDSNHDLQIHTNGGERMRISTTGDVGIGYTSPAYKLQILSNKTTTTNIGCYVNAQGASTNNYAFYADCTQGTSTNFAFYAASGKSAFLNDVGIGTDAPTYRFHVKSSNNVSIFEDTSGSSGATFCLFNAPSVFAMGSITRNGSANSVLFNTGSDYRLKEDLQDFNALDLVDNITAYDYKWKDTEQRDYGFVAHELQEVMPNVVTGEKDGERMQSVDYSKLTPVLLKAIQELKAEIETLKAQINN